MAWQGSLAGLLLLLLAPQGQPALQSQGSSVQEKLQDTGLLNQMLTSFRPTDTPNPSVLLALRLANDHDLEVERVMAQGLKEDAVRRVQNSLEFTSGTVALYVMALQASCENPRAVSALGSTVDLVQLLKNKYEQEMKNYDKQKKVLTNFFQIGLDIIALCLQNVPVDLGRVLSVSCPTDHYGYGEHHSVDTASVLALGLACVADQKALQPKKRPAKVRIIRDCLVNRILREKKADGVIGNIHSTGLAMQALAASPNSYEPSHWDRSQTLSAVLDAVSKGEFSNPMAASQIIPSLHGRTYLDAGTVTCSADPGNLQVISNSLNKAASSSREISVSYRVIDGVSRSFSNSITVAVPEGSTFLVVMETAQRLNPQDFSFTTKKSRWGPLVVSINGLAASAADRTYWQLQSGDKPLERGIGDYKPSAGEQLVSIFTTY